MERKTRKQHKKAEMLFKRYQTTSFSTDIIYSRPYPKYIRDGGQECKNKIHRLNIWTEAEQNYYLITAE